jgi:hypothetical protein
VFENRVLRGIYGPQTDRVTGVWRKPRNEELHSFYSLLIVIRMIKSSTMIRAGHVACIRGRGMRIGFRWERQKEMGHEDLEVGGWIILKWGGIDWIDLAQDKEEWRALVNLRIL